MEDQHGPTPDRRSTARAEFARAYRAHAAALYRYAIMLTADVTMAEDAIQQVFVKLLRRSGPCPPAVLEVPYLRRAVRNECYRILAHRRREPTALEGDSILAPASDGPADPEEQEMIERALRRLPPDQREVIHMRIYEELTFQQIADQIGESVNTIAGRYRYGLEKLHRLLTPRREEAV